MGKVVLLDGGKFTFTSIELWGGLFLKKIKGEMASNAYIAPSYITYMSMIISALKKIRIYPEDIVILCCDGRNSWRKAFYPQYKGQRWDLREKKTHIDYMKHFDGINKYNEKIENGTKIHVLGYSDILSYEDLLVSEEGQKYIKYDEEVSEKTYGIEADDLIAVACEFFKDRECIVVTGDKDLLQLDHWPNTKIFYMNLKTPKGLGTYAIDVDPLKIIADKCRLGDASDNILVDKENDTEKDGFIREFIINLLKLPGFIKYPLMYTLGRLKEKPEDLNRLPFTPTLNKRYAEIYTDKNLVTYEYCVQQHEKREKAKKEKAKKNLLNRRKR